jgi:hypothetical protein
MAVSAFSFCMKFADFLGHDEALLSPGAVERFYLDIPSPFGECTTSETVFAVMARVFELLISTSGVSLYLILTHILYKRKHQFIITIELETMTQEKQQTRPGILESKYWKVILTVIAALLTFGSPYLVYVMTRVTRALDMGWFISIGSGGVLFAVGLALIWYLIKKKVIS